MQRNDFSMSSLKLNTSDSFERDADMENDGNSPITSTPKTPGKL